MALSATCPSCKSQVTVASAPEGGRVTCPNPQCGKPFAVPASAVAAARATAVSAAIPRARAGAGRSSALSKLPANFFASPAFISGGAAVIFLYGFMLFAVLSNQRKRELEALATEPPPLVARHEEPIPLPEPTPSPPPAPTTPAKAATPAKVEHPAGPGGPPGPPPGSTSPPAPTTPSPPAEPTKPAPAEPRKTAPDATKPALAARTPTVPKTPEPVVIAGIGRWLDPDGDCQVRQDSGEVTIQIPGTLHLLSPQLQRANSPRVLTEVSGDFVAQVRIPGRILPGTQTLKDIPFTFQGAGLLVWENDGNFLRLERSAANALEKPLVHSVLLETCRDGRPGRPVYLPIRERPITLRIERRGNDVNCTYSPDGETWLPVKSSAIPFANKLGVGISASNASPKPFTARFEGFSLERGAGKAAGARRP